MESRNQLMTDIQVDNLDEEKTDPLPFTIE